MNDNEMCARQKLARQNENATIVRDYTTALLDGCADFTANGCRGSFFDAIRTQMIAKGVVQS